MRRLPLAPLPGGGRALVQPIHQDDVTASLRAALARAGNPVARVVLFDCTVEERRRRLTGPRGQPELASSRMDAWAVYLRGQADALELPVIDTTAITIDRAATVLEREVHRGRRLAAARWCHQDHVGLADGPHLDLAVALVHVDHDVRECGPRQVQGLIDALGGDESDVRERPWGSQEVDPTGMADERSLEQDPIHPRHVLGELGQRVDRFQIEQGGEVASGPAEPHRVSDQCFDRGGVAGGVGVVGLGTRGGRVVGGRATLHDRDGAGGHSDHESHRSGGEHPPEPPCCAPRRADLGVAGVAAGVDVLALHRRHRSTVDVDRLDRGFQP